MPRIIAIANRKGGVGKRQQRSMLQQPWLLPERKFWSLTWIRREMRQLPWVLIKAEEWPLPMKCCSEKKNL